MSLYHKYRPTSFEDIKGNSDIVSSLKGMLSNRKTMSRVYLFHGPTGCGKTTLARIIKNTLKVSDKDYQEIDSAQFNGVEMIRQLRSNCQFKPIESDFRIFVLDECHMLSTSAQEAMLKILEDTPKHAIFILATTEPNKLKKTILGRTSQFQVSLLTDREMKELLKKVAKGEDEILKKQVIKQIILDSNGHARNALQILEQVLNTDEDQRLEAAKQTAQEYSESIELCKALLANSSWKTVAPILKKLKQQNAESIRRHVLAYATAFLLNKDNPKAGLILEEFCEPTYNSGFPQLVLASYIVISNS